AGGVASTAGLLNGVAIDGYLQGSTVFLDVNNNGAQDTGEPSALTDASGRYTLDYSKLTTPINGLAIVVTGGIDTDTGFAFTGRLSAKADKTATGQVITPLTSLVDAVLAEGLAKGLSVADLAADPVAALVNKPGIYTTAVELQRVVQLLASMNAVTGESAHKAQERVLKALAQAIKPQGNAVSISQLVAASTLTNKAGAERLATSVHETVKTSLTSGGHDSAKLALKGLDQVRVRMESDHDDDLDKAAGKLDSERGLTTSKPYTNLVKKDAGHAEVVAITTVLGQSTV
ncbi:hypothetical protein JZU56_00505, partial [bacterium]|nr:hypothetical protein [bacterium]